MRFFFEKISLCCAAFCVASLSCVTVQQHEIVNQSIHDLLGTMQQRLPREKLYLQLDKPYYATGDTIWFKGYLLNADSLDASYRSGMLYLELANDRNEVVQRISLLAVGGLCWGDLPLDTVLFHPGAYTLRAYSNWMLNFGEAGIFSKQIHIVSSEKKYLDCRIAAAK